MDQSNLNRKREEWSTFKGTHMTPVYFDKILCEESWYKMSNIFRELMVYPH